MSDSYLGFRGGLGFRGILLCLCLDSIGGTLGPRTSPKTSDTTHIHPP